MFLDNSNYEDSDCNNYSFLFKSDNNAYLSYSQKGPK